MTDRKMLLVLDVGNTNIHLGIYRDENLLVTWDISHQRGRTADEFSLILKNLLRESGFSPREVGGAAVACVVPPVVSVVERSLEGTFGLEPLFVGPETHRDVLRLFDDPSEVGADRIANVVGGYHRYGGPLIVVDFGTATTFDAVSEEGIYLGGAIAPGISISTEALFSKAAKLPRIDLVRPLRAVGKNTVESMQSGIVFGYAGLVEALVSRFRREIGESAEVVATGGLAQLIVRETGALRKVDEHLTLEGLRLLYELHRRAGGDGDDAGGRLSPEPGRHLGVDS
jgi:type III pantothenate kinase